MPQPDLKELKGNSGIIHVAAPRRNEAKQSEFHPEHVGVWLDRCYCPTPNNEKTPETRRALYDQAVDALKRGRPAVENYRVCYNRWALEARDPFRAMRSVIVEATSRVLLHPSSNASVTEGAILMHHTYGVPYLPGSGLKGVARAWLRRSLQPSDQRTELERALFGYSPQPEHISQPSHTTSNFGARQSENPPAGHGSSLDFLDALWVPAPPHGAESDWSPLAVDVVNPHLSNYYTNTNTDTDTETSNAPADHLDPIPTHRLTVRPGTQFLLIVEGVGEESYVRPWVNYAVDQLLLPALQESGFGAWTSSGYGRFTPLGGKTSVGAASPSSETTDWHLVTITLNPGSGELQATLPAGKHAFVRRPKSDALRNNLSPEAQKRLKDKRVLRVQIRIEKNDAEGKSNTIIDIREYAGEPT